MLRNWPIRTKLVVILVVPLAALAALSAVAVRDNVENVRASDRIRVLAGFAVTTNDLVHELQRERFASATLYQAGDQYIDQIVAVRGEVDTAIAKYNEAEAALPSATRDSVAETLATSRARLDGLKDHRSRYDDAVLTRDEVVDFYGALISDLLVLDTRVGAGSRDTDLVNRANTLDSFSQAKEAFDQQRGYVASLLFVPDLPPQAVQGISQIVQNAAGAEGAWLAQFRTSATPEERQFYDATVSSAADQVAQIRDGTIFTILSGQRPQGDPEQWLTISQTKLDKMRDVERRIATDLAGASDEIASAAARDAWFGGVGVTLVLALSIAISLLVASPMIRQLRRLRRSALETANVRLPGVVERLHRGESVDVSAELFHNEYPSRDEIGQLAEAFGTVHRVAVATAVEQAAMRKSIGDTFLNLARRSQALIHRQLKIIDALERKETDPDELDELFRLDHLATRMRRHAEDLIVLSGSKPARGWRRPVPVKDVIRGAVAEVEDYTRVKVLPVNAGAISGHAVGDVIHMLAELIENATSFSPPHTPVHVSGHEVSNGAAIEIEDRGLGMTDEELAAINERLANPPPFDLKTSERLGLFVVGRLAERHSIKVKLRPSPYGGTMAIVLVPATLLRDDETVARSGGPGADPVGPPTIPFAAVGHEPRELTAVGASSAPTPARGTQLDGGDPAGMVEQAHDRAGGEPAAQTPYGRAAARHSGDAPPFRPGDDDSPLMDDLPVFATVRSSWFVADRDRSAGDDPPWSPSSNVPGATTVGPPPLGAGAGGLAAGGLAVGGVRASGAPALGGDGLGSDGLGSDARGPGRDNGGGYPPLQGSVLDVPYRVDTPPPGAPGSGPRPGTSSAVPGAGPGAGASTRSGSGSGSSGARSGTERPRVHPTTEVGLPKRTRRSHLAPELRRNAAEHTSVPTSPGVVAGPRSPDEIRSMMTSFQTNFGRGLEDGRGAGDDDPPTTTNRGR